MGKSCLRELICSLDTMEQELCEFCRCFDKHKKKSHCRGRERGCDCTPRKESGHFPCPSAPCEDCETWHRLLRQLREAFGGR